MSKGDTHSDAPPTSDNIIWACGATYDEGAIEDSAPDESMAKAWDNLLDKASEVSSGRRPHTRRHIELISRNDVLDQDGLWTVTLTARVVWKPC